MAFETDPPRMLSADDIWACQDIEERDVYVPQWRGSVRIKTFSKRQIDQMNAAARIRDRFGKESLDSVRLEAQLFCAGVIEPHFEPDDYERLKDKSGVAVSTILNAIITANGLSELANAEATKSLVAEPRTANGVPPGARARDDAGGIIATYERV